MANRNLAYLYAVFRLFASDGRQAIFRGSGDVYLGGGTDIQARLLSKIFQQDLGQNFVIDNRTGDLTLDNYVRVLTRPFFQTAMLNSLIVGVGGMLGALALGIPLAALGWLDPMIAVAMGLMVPAFALPLLALVAAHQARQDPIRRAQLKPAT